MADISTIGFLIPSLTFGGAERVVSVLAEALSSDFAVYVLVQTQMGGAREQVMFVSSNGWDVAGAARYGFTTVWVNRAGLPVDRLSDQPAHIIADLTELPALWSFG